MCRKAPYPRCSNHARLALQKAVASGDEQRIRKAKHNWYLSPAGLAELQVKNPELAEKYATRRTELIDMASRPLRVGLDLDNTSGDFTDGLRQHVSKATGKPTGHYQEPEHYSLVESGWFKDKEEFLSHFRAAEQAGMYRTIRPFARLQENLKTLIAEGAEIHIVSARGAEWEADTKAWLAEHGVPYHSLTFTNDKEKLTNIDVYLDDADYQVAKLNAHEKQVLVFDQAYNRDVGDHLPRVHHWDNVPSSIRQIKRDRGFQLVSGKTKHVADTSQNSMA